MDPRILYIVVPVISTCVAYIFKYFTGRLEKLENEMDTKITETSVRILVNDKIEPLKDQLDRIDNSLNKLIDVLMQQGKPNV